MNYRRLGSSELLISEVGLGTWPLGGPVLYKDYSVGWRGIDDGAALKIIRACSEAGINFIDTADIYGNGRAESLIGTACAELGEAGKKMIIATKVGFVVDRDLPPGRNQDFSEAHIRRSCEGSLKRLKREVIDLYQLHNVPLEVIEHGDAFGILDQLKKEGKIREYGVSIVKTTEALAALEHPGVRSIQIIFNIFRQKPAHELFEKAVQRGVGILARVPLASGLLTGKFKADHKFESGDHRSQNIPGETFSGVNFGRGLKAVGELASLVKPGVRTMAQAALQYTLSFSAVCATIPGALSLEQLRENAGAAALGEMNDADLALCRQVYERRFAKEMEARF